MSMSIYDFDTSHAPFEAFANETPFAPFALWGWYAAPMLWWTDAYLNACGMMSDAIVSAMTYPYVGSPNQNDGHANGQEKRVA